MTRKGNQLRLVVPTEKGKVKVVNGFGHLKGKAPFLNQRIPREPKKKHFYLIDDFENKVGLEMNR